MTTENTPSHGTLGSYTTGFVLSILLTFEAYWLVAHHVLVGNALIGAVIFLAVLQLIVQLFFFLHLGNKGNPRLNLVTFLFMLMVVTIVVGGSLWIMNHLNYNLTAAQTSAYIQGQDSL